MKLSLRKADSVGKRIIRLVAETALLAVLVASLTNIVVNLYSSRFSKVTQITAIAEVVSKSSTAAVSFNEPESAVELLASLSSRSNIAQAFILTPDGKVFASYSKQKDVPVETSGLVEPGISWTASGTLEVRVPINEFDQPIGTLVIRSFTDDIRASVLKSVLLSGLIAVLVLVVGISLAVRIQRAITRPIIELTQTAQEISDGGNYSLRVENKFEGEIGRLCQQFNQMLERIETADQWLQEAHQKLVLINEELEMRVETRTRELEFTNQQLQREIQDKMRTNQELQDLQGQLIETSRQAGMAEIANGVLHNVGNVLNSVNVSSTIVADKISELRGDSLHKAAELLQENKHDLAGYFAKDKRSRYFPEFIQNLANHVQTTQETIVAEVRSLNDNVGFIKEIIQSQQSFAGGHGMIMTVCATSIFDDALRFVGANLERDRITVYKDYAFDECFDVDKNKLLQILTNFIKNARESLLDVCGRDKILKLSIRETAKGDVEFSVTDNGIGIHQSHLARIFTHGHTTKQHGHGFGLHSAAIAAKEMSGKVRVQSNGPNLGATFTVVVPKSPPERDFPIVEIPVIHPTNAHP